MGDQCAGARRAKGSRKIVSPGAVPEPPRSHSTKPPAQGRGRAGAKKEGARPPGEPDKAVSPRGSPSLMALQGAGSARSHIEKGSTPRELGSVVNGKGAAPEESDAAPSGKFSAPTEKGAAPSGKASACREKGAAPSGKASAPREKGAAPNGKASAPREKGAAPSGKDSAPSGKDSAPREKGAAPSGKASAPREKGAAPNGKASATREKGAAPSGKDSAPSGKDSAPREKGAAPREKGTVSKPKESAPGELLAVASYPCLGAERCISVKQDGVGTWRLRDVLKRLSLGRQDTSEASECVNQLIRTLVPVIRTWESTFSLIDRLGTGSYYEHVKISAPNEFDIMLTMPAPRVELEQCDDSGAFYYVRLKRNPQGNNLDKFLNEDGTLAAWKMLSALRNIIKAYVKSKTGTEMKVTLDKKKAGSPAITLCIGALPIEISVDIILALEVRSQSWPASTQDGLKIEKWLGSKVKQEYKWKPIYIVPKHAKDGRVLKEDTWRLSFSHIEKVMIKNHGNTKTCCESKGIKCCRKDCLKLLKHLLDQLKTKYGNRRGMDKFCSYHAKTAFFQACVLWPDDSQWLFTDLESCFQKFLDYFLDCLNKAYLPHFFIPTYNLFSVIDKASRDFLSKEIKYEINNRFPIFELQN
ncbi:cyclic GMP-AMP synthase [Emydura macquarii macquarii]|uniref:cyclic GMP-AMP synthase n=1 Tax=Emydura macquarii macquarii TaxID=1129001 RepID=UPI00352B6821